MNVLVFSLVAYPQSSHAAGSKVATMAAKKVVKEIVKDSAVQMAMDIAFEYEMKQMMAEKFDNPDDGYKAVCLEQKDDKCTKPAQVKVPTSADEKKAVANKAEEILERKTGTHKGWAKFLDWFIPIFLVGGAVSWISAKFDGDTIGLFDEIARESLEGLGLIKPITPKETPMDIVDSEGVSIPEPSPTDWSPTTPQTIAKPTVFEMDFSNKEAHTQKVQLSGSVNYVNSMFMVEVLSNNPNRWVQSININNQTGYRWSMYSGNSSFKTGVYGTWWPTYAHTWDERGAKNVNINGSPWNYPPGVSWSYLEGLPNHWQPTRVIIAGALAGNDGYGIQGYLMTNGGNVASFNGATQSVVSGSVNLGTISVMSETMIGYSMKVKVSVYPDARTATFSPYTPKLEEFPNLTFDKSIYNTGNFTYKVPSPMFVPVKTTEGVNVKPDGKGGWTDLAGTPIQLDEDTLIVEDIETTPDGSAIKSPEGVELPKPDPSENPEREEEKEDDYPSCDKDFEDIEFKKVGVAFTHAFPFSIPWDIKRMVDAQLGGIGDEKPSFELSFLGDGIELTIPDFIDKWMPFARGLMIFMFDIAILFLFYRFMKGGD